MRAAVLLLLLTASCAPPRRCLLLVECTCNCTNGSSGQVNGRACVDEEHEGDCAAWAAPKRQAVEAVCLKSCSQKHGDSTAQCQLASLPGNPVVTATAGSCPLK